MLSIRGKIVVSMGCVVVNDLWLSVGTDFYSSHTETKKVDKGLQDFGL